MKPSLHITGIMIQHDYTLYIFDKEELDENHLLLDVQLHVLNILPDKNEVHIFFNIIIPQVSPN